MSIFSNIKSILGLSPDVDNSQDQAQAPGTARSLPPAAATGDDVEVPSQVVDQIFDHVVETFNAALPGFLAGSVDPERERKMLYDSLSASIKDYLGTLEQAVQAKCEAVWNVERERMQADAEALRKRAADLEDKRTALNDRQLSAERQKRALSERLHDLENQVLALEAEKEQLVIENKCMVNKTKATAVLEAEIEELREQLKAAHGGAAPALTEQQKQELEAAHKQALADATEAHRQALTDAETAHHQALADAMEQAQNEHNAQIQALNEEIVKLNDVIEAQKVKVDMSDAMFNDFKSRTAEAHKAAAEANAKVEQLEADIALKDARIADLQKEVQEKEAQLIDDSDTQAQIEEIQRQVSMFEEVKNKLDARIEQLKANLENAQKENESLRLTIKNNLLENVEQQKALHQEIDELKSKLEDNAVEDSHADAEQQMPAIKGDKPRSAKRSKRQPLPDVEEMIGESEWLVSVPPKDSSMRATDNDDFGYQPPQRKTPKIDNAAQMSLFDF